MVGHFARAARIVAVALLSIGPAQAQQSLKILIPSDDTCTAYVAAMNTEDRPAILNLGGWALGYWSALAEQSGKDILHDTTSEALLDRLATECQAQPNAPMSSIVETIGRSLVSGASP